MVNIDTVYQRVLVLANKEQRGYITPQEFNLLANQACLEIVEQYFYDLNQFSRTKGNDTGYSDMLTLLDEKIGYLTVNNHVISFNWTDSTYSTAILPDDLYQLGSVTVGTAVADKVTYKEFIELNKQNTLFKPGGLVNGCVYWVENRGGHHSIAYVPASTTEVYIDYIRKPKKANWNYVVVNSKALYDPSNSQHFDIHPLEESELVYKILKLAGISSKAQDITASGQGLENVKVQQEKI